MRGIVSCAALASLVWCWRGSEERLQEGPREGKSLAYYGHLYKLDRRRRSRRQWPEGDDECARYRTRYLK